ncbi:MAG TPA: hypothetical protein VHR47_07165 [Bacillota bacterium]|nr:hypothetical protein [Bacillota bacterium]
MRGRLIFVLFLMVALVTVGGYQANSYAASTKDEAVGSILVSVKDPQPISPYAYGQNYWNWSPAWGDPVHGSQKQIGALKLNLLRAGGYNNDAQTPNRWDIRQADEYIAYCRSVGAEPLFQIAILKGSAEEAAEWVRYCNIEKKYNVKFWIIGNEPDLYAGKDKKSYDVNDYIADFKAYAAAMKAVDPAIKVLGPELSWKYQVGNSGNDWWTPFRRECHDDVDIVTFHRYPFAVADATVNNAFRDNTAMRGLIQKLRIVVDQYAGPEKPLAITEANISWDGDPAKSTQSASPQTFAASLWIADAMGVALEEHLWTNAFWSISEGWTLGFLSSDTKHPKPNYYGLYMFTNFFGTSLIHPTDVPKGLSVYASRDAGNKKTILIVINKTKKDLNETIQINDLVTPVTKQHIFPAYSITAITIPDDGSAPDVWLYSKAARQPRHSVEP